MIEINKIYNEDCIITMGNIPDNFIDLTVTSPPYDNLRKYNSFMFDFENIAKELYRVTKKGGVVVWVVADQSINGSETGTSFKQALYFKEIGFNIYDTMIYMKANPVPLNDRRYEQAFEYMFVFSKGMPKTFNGLREKKLCDNKRAITSFHRDPKDEHSLRKMGKSSDVKDKLRTNIWSYYTGGMKTTKDKIAYKHPAIFPDKLAYEHIYSWSHENDIVYDPFAGSGTVAKMCIYLKRNYIGSEISKEYMKIINQRINSIENKLI